MPSGPVKFLLGAFSRAGFAVPLVWALVFQAAPRSEAWAEALLLCGPWVLVPLGLAGERRHEAPRLVAAAGLTLALCLNTGLVAAALVLPWLVWTLREAWQAGRRTSRHPVALCGAAAWAFLVPIFYLAR